MSCSGCPNLCIALRVRLSLIHIYSTERSADWVNLGIWVIGFIIYRGFMKIDIPLGSTIPAMAVTMILAAAAGLIFKGEKKNV